MVFTKDDDLVQNLETLAPLGKSDHSVVVIELNLADSESEDTNGRPTACKKDFMLSKGNYEAINQALAEINWDLVFKNKSVNEMWLFFKGEIERLCNAHIPMKSNASKKDPLWMTSEVKQIVHEKHKTWMKYYYCRTDLNYKEYKLANKKCSKVIQQAQKSLEHKIANEVKDNPKSFWKYIKSKTKPKNPVGRIFKKNGELTDNDRETAVRLNQYFSEVFTKDDEQGIDISLCKDNSFIPQMDELIINDNDIKKQLKALKRDTASGPDNMIPRVLIEIQNEIVQPLSKIFSFSLQYSDLPADWRDALVIPIFKKGSKREAGNYRPVSPTSVVCKMMETILRDKIMNHLLTNKLISDAQYGFLPGRSCTLQLLNMLDIWTQQLDLNKNIDIIYTDLRKAFDSVSHNKLMVKLDFLNFDPKILNWIGNFLYNRRQRVRVQSEVSNWTHVLSGVPQGSVLGPVLFLIYINDMVDVISYSLISLFADDTKLSNTIGRLEDASYLQSDLDSIVQWSKKWSLRFNPQKCKVLHLGKHNEKFSYSMMEDGNRIILDQVPFEKDLGVYIDQDLSFNKHIGEAIGKANRILGLIRRSFKYLTAEIFVHLYKTLLRPFVEYSSPVWSPYKKKDIILIEGIQRRATKLVSEINHLSYPNRLKFLGLHTLEYRRLRADLIQVYKILTKKENVDPEMFFQIRGNERTRGHKFKLNKQSNTNIRKHFFTNRIVDSWNALPSDVVEVETVLNFKTKLESFYSDNEMKFIPSFMQ